VSDELPPRRPPLEPFPLLHVVGGKAVSLADLSGQIGALGAQMTSVQSGQVKLARRFDELDGSVVGQLGAFHQELALLRHELSGTGGVQERVTAVEQVQRTALQKAGAGAMVMGKYTLVFSVAGIILRAAAKQWPQFGGLIEGILQGLGL